MKNILKKSIILPSLALLAAVSFSACSDWNEPESLDIKTPSLEEQNPELNAAYLESLRAYKAGAHKVLFVATDNPIGAPAVNRSQNLTVIPDSVDYIILNNPDNLHPTIIAEMAKVREKATKVIFKVDYTVFDAEWSKITKADVEGLLTDQDELDYFARRAQEMLALCAEFNYDGLIVSYPGRSLVSLPPKELEAYTLRQKNFLEPIAAWREANVSKLFAFEGSPQFLIPESKAIFAKCDYIILQTDKLLNVGDMGVAALMAMGTDIPSDRFVLSVQTVPLGDEEKILGYFGTLDAEGNKVRSIGATAQWLGMPAEYTKAGMLINNGQNDYFDVKRFVYRYTREAIDLMNPSPKN